MLETPFQAICYGILVQGHAKLSMEPITITSIVFAPYRHAGAMACSSRHA